MLNTLIRPFAHLLPESNRLERIWVLAKVDFLKRYYGSFLGVLWAFINPLFQLLIYYTVFTVVRDSTEDNFALFLFLGLILYLFFTEAVQKSLTLFSRNQYIFENIQINKLDLYFASISSAFLGFAFNFIGFVFMSLFFSTVYSIDLVFLPLILITLIIFTLGAMLLFSVIQAFYKDFVHVWNLTSMALLWLSGIFFQIDPTVTWKSAILAYMTPLPGIIMNARNVLMDGEMINWGMLLYSFGYSILVLMIGLGAFRRFALKAIEKM